MLWKSEKGETDLECKFDFEIWVVFRQSEMKGEGILGCGSKVMSNQRPGGSDAATGGSGRPRPGCIKRFRLRSGSIIGLHLRFPVHLTIPKTFLEESCVL